MKAWISETHSDDDGPTPLEGKDVIIHATKEEVLALVAFMSEVADYLQNNEYCHMHLRDHMKNWDKDMHIDIELTVEKKS